MGQTTRCWMSPTAGSGPAYTPQLTDEDYVRLWAELDQFRRFKMPTRSAAWVLDQQREDHLVRTATVSNGAYLGKAHSAREWG